MNKKMSEGYRGRLGRLEKALFKLRDLCSSSKDRDVKAIIDGAMDKVLVLYWDSMQKRYAEIKERAGKDYAKQMKALEAKKNKNNLEKK
jgi:hypothetical protein